MKIDNKKYDEIINEVVKKENPFKNCFIAFFTGGLIAIIGQFITNVFNKYYSLSDSYLLTFLVLVLVGSLLTGIGIFDKVLSICKCGLIVPSTGFANSMTSSAMDNRSEGFVKGVGANIFKLTGSIILYGVVFGIIFGYVRSMI